MADSFEEDSFEPDDRPRTEGGAQGGGGSDSAPSKPIPKRDRMGGLKEFLKSWANTAALGAGPQIEGGMAAVMQDFNNLIEGEPLNPKVTPLDAYREVRDMGKREHADAEKTAAGNIAKLPGMLMTPSPVKVAPGASIPKRALAGAVVSGPTAAISSIAQSPIDLTQEHSMKEYLDLLKDTGTAFGVGTLTGAGTGAGLGLLEKPLRSTARKLPMDILGVGEPARRSMQRQGIYDEAGDELLKLVRPLRSGMRKGSLTEDVLDELQKRGKNIGAAEAAIDAAAPDGVMTTEDLAESIRDRSTPYQRGSVQDKQVAKRMGREADNAMLNHGDLLPEVPAPVSLAEAEAFKQRFGPAVAKQLRHAGEPAAKTDALAETYRALKNANEEAARAVDPKLAEQFTNAKKRYQLLAAPAEGANIERSGMRSSDFDWGEMLSSAPAPDSALSKLVQNSALAAAIKAPIDLAGRAYGRGTAAKLSEFLANKAQQNTGGSAVGIGSAEALEPWSRFLREEEQP